MNTLLIMIIYLAFISLGLPDSLLGSAWPTMYLDVEASLSSLGIISMVISGGTIISSLLSDKLTKRFGTQKVTFLSVLLTAIALIAFSYSDSFPMLIIAAIPYGFGAGAIDAALNNYVAIHYSSKHMSWLHCFWGIGTIISPFVISYSLANSTWNTGYRIIALIQLFIAFILAISAPIWKINKSQAFEENENSKSLKLFDALKIKGVPSLLLGFLAYCAAEGTAMSWSCTYLVEAKELDEPAAAALASCFLIGMTAGRFIGGFFMDRLGDRKMILIGTIISILGVSLLFVNSNTVVYAGLIIIGLGCAPIYPCIIHSTPSNFGTDNSSSIIGIQMASAYTGSTFLPPLFGVLAKAIGFELFPTYIFLFMVIMIIMIERTFNITTK